MVSHGLLRKIGLAQVLQSSLGVNAYYLLANSLTQALLGFAFWMMAARYYDTREVGLASAAISAISLLALISTLGLDYGLIRFLPHRSERSNETINSCLALTGLVALLVALAFLAGLGLWAPDLSYLRENPLFFIGFLVFTLAFALSIVLRQTFVAKRRASLALAQGTILTLLRLPLILLFTLFGAFGILASWGTASLVAITASLLLFVPRVQAGYRPSPRIKREAVSDMVRFSLSNHASVLLWNAPILILPLMVVSLVGATSNAYFYIAWTLAYLLSVIPTAAALSLFAEGSHDRRQLSHNTRNSLRLVMFLLLPAVAGLLLLGHWLLLLFGEEYAGNATTLVRVVALSAIPLSLNQLYFSLKRVKGEMRGVIGLTAFIAISALGLSYWLLPQMGILGAGVAWLTSQSIAAVLMAPTLWRAVRDKVSSGSPGGHPALGTARK